MALIDLSGREDVPVPEEVIAALLERSEVTGLQVLVVGAAARDLVIHAQLKERPARSTLDVDIAVAVGGDGDFTEFCAPFERIGGSEHAFRVCGAEVDVVPFGE